MSEIHFQVRFFGETDDEACGRLREEERQRGGGGVGNEQGEVGQGVLFTILSKAAIS